MMLKKLSMAWLAFYFWIGLGALFPLEEGFASDASLHRSHSATVEDVKIPVAADVSLTGKLYQRKDVKKPQAALIFIAPWSVGIWVYDKKAKDLAERGYIVLAYNSRGWGGSQGEADSAGPSDVADAARVVDWLTENPLVDGERIGMAGISLGAGTALMAAAYDARIRAVVALSGWSDLLVSTFGNQTRRTLWNKILKLSAGLTGGKTSASAITDEYINKREFEKIKEYTDPRSPIHVIDRFRAHQTAIFISQNYSDFLFPVNDLWNLFEKLESPKKIRLQPGIHASAEVLELFFDQNGDLWQDAQTWLDTWVRDSNQDMDRRKEASQIHLRLPDETRDLEFQNLAALNIQTARFYFNKPEKRGFNRLMQEAPQEPSQHVIRAATYSGVNAGIPLIYPLLDSLKPFDTNMKSRRIRLDRAAVYEWGPVNTAFKILGIPRLHVKLESDQKAAHLVAYLYKVTPTDEWKLISIAPYTSYDLTPGTPQLLNFELFNGFASIKKGEKLVLAFDTFDPEFSALSQQDYQIKVYADGTSTLDLPLRYELTP